MGARFLSASSQRWRVSGLPVMAYPWSMGFLFQMNTGQTGDLLMSLTDSTADADGHVIYQGASNRLYWGAFDGGGYDEANTTGAVTTGHWHFGIMRAISATNRRFSFRLADGSVSSLQATGSITPTNNDAFAFGGWAGLTPGADYSDSAVADVWYMVGDCQPGGGALDSALLYAVEKNGPLAISTIANAPQLFYDPLRDSLDGGKGDYYSTFRRPVVQAFNNPLLISV